MMATWNPGLYLKFGSERTRPAWDLANQIPLESPRNIVDLGCGPGNSTAVLRSKWPGASLTGIDSSADMLGKAVSQGLDAKWIQADLRDWSPQKKYGLIFSNAVFQWIHTAELLLETCVDALEPGGFLAFQVPCNAQSPYYTCILELAGEPQWAGRFQDIPLLRYETTQAYYDLLSSHSLQVNAWETQYFHIMDDVDSIVEWISGTGLRPYLDALPNKSEQADFKAQLLELYHSAYSPSNDGKVLFPFNRQFFVAQKP